MHISKWLEDANVPRLFVEPEWETYPRSEYILQYSYITHRTLRIRTALPKTAKPLILIDWQERMRRDTELRNAVMKVINDPTEARPREPPRIMEPRGFAYYVELVQKLAPWYDDWHTLVSNMGALAIRHAHLFGREKTNEDDFRLLARVAADSVPYWIRRLMMCLLIGPSSRRTIDHVMPLGGYMKRSGYVSKSKYGTRAEVHRVSKNGMINWVPVDAQWEISPRHALGIQNLLDGRAFGLEQSKLAAVLA